MARAKIPLVALGPTGSLLSGAAVTVTRRSDGATPVVYADELTPAVLPQPLTTDTRGRVPGWLDRGGYHAVFTYPSLSAWTEDFECAPASDGTVDNAWLPALGIGSGKFAAKAIQSGDVADGAVINRLLGAGAVLLGNLGAGSVDSSKIVDGSITALDIQDATISQQKLAFTPLTEGLVKVLGTTPGGLPISGSFTLAQGGNYTFIGFAAAYTQVAGAAIQIGFGIDTTASTAQARGYSNENSSHKAITPAVWNMNLGAGSHTFNIHIDSVQTSTDSNDFFAIVACKSP